MNTNSQTSKVYFKSLQIIFYALIAGQVFFGAVIFSLIHFMKTDFGGQELRDIFIYVVPVFALGGIAGSYLLFKNKLKATINKTSLSEKMTDYRGALMIRYALLEGPSFLSLVVYLLTSDLIFLGIAGLVILIFFTMMPTNSKAVKDLELNPTDEKSIMDPDSAW